MCFPASLKKSPQKAFNFNYPFIVFVQLAVQFNVFCIYKTQCLLQTTMNKTVVGKYLISNFFLS